MCNRGGCFGGCDDFLWIIILIFIICNCCGGNEGNKGIGGGPCC